MITAAAVLTISVAAIASTVIEVGDGPLTIEGGVLPKKLPKHKMAPITLRVAGQISKSHAAGAQRSALTELTIDFDKDGSINNRGLAVCKRSQVKRDPRITRRVCRKAIVGTGIAHVAIDPSPMEPIPIPLTLFNGGVKGNAAIVFIQSSITAASPTPIVTTVKVKAIQRGRYGLQATARIPPIAEGSGLLLDFRLTVKRRFNHKGVTQSYAIARCFDRRLSATPIRIVFRNGQRFSGPTVTLPCAPMG